MKLAIIGSGYVGLVSGACFADLGHEVFCVDKDLRKIKELNKGVLPIYEPGLEELVTKNKDIGRLKFTDNMEMALENVDCVMLAVGTPSLKNDRSVDLSFIFEAVKDVAKLLKKDSLIVTKSTVPVNTGYEIAKIVKELRPDLKCEVASNPEFLREGSAVDDFMKPDRLIIGANTDEAREVLQQIYQKLIWKGIPVLFTNVATAELTKYASNAFLAMKICFSNEMADICEKVGADIDLVIKGMGMDKRIGARNMNPGPGFGGSCFPKDTRGLADIAIKSGAPSKLVEAVIVANENRKKQMADRVVSVFNNAIHGKKVAVLGVAFKANTDDIRESPSLDIINELIDKGANVALHDPKALNEARSYFGNHKSLQFCEDPYEAIKDSDVIAIVTEWQEFKAIDWEMAASLVKSKNIVDMRNILKELNLAKYGYNYRSIGTKF